MYFWVKETKYYNAYIQQNLFGGSSVICSWGSLKNKIGRFKITPCDHDIQLNTMLANIKKRRKYRGYKEID